MKRTLALILSLVMCLGLLAGCGDKNTGNQTKDENTPLVVGYAAFNEKFSPFFSETEYDQDVWVMTSLGLLNSDRQGQIIMNGIEGETHAYNGTDYTYYGPADCEIVENADGTVDYNFTMRDDIVFSDGEKVTIDDVIFSMYVLCDPTYDGNSTLYAVPIQGMAAYRSGMTTLAKAIAAAGRDNADFTYWTEEQQTKFWDNFDKGLVPFAQGIVDYCVEAGAADEGDVSRVIVEALAPLERELTVLTVSSSAGIVTCTPIGQRQESGDYRESWQPATEPDGEAERARDIARTAVEGLVAKAQAAGETGWGVFGVELFVLTDGSILFNEVSPRPHDTGMLTMASQRLSEFALHARAILGLPITPKHVALTIPAGSVAASHAIVVAGDGEAEFTDVAAALAEPGTDLRIFAKPEVHGHRRMAVALAVGESEADARAKAGLVADALTITVE